MFENTHKIIVSGLQRSGHHAIAIWLAHQLKNIPIDAPISPVSLSQWLFFIEHSDGINFLLNNPLRPIEGEGKEHFYSFFADYEYMNPNLIVATHGVDECKPHEIMDIVNNSPVFGKETDKIIVLRDYYNWAASCLGMVLRDGDKLLEEVFNDVHLDTYIEHCERYLDRDDNFTFLSFNQWAEDDVYRKEFAESLGLDFTDAAREQTSIFGGGSSFDGLDHLKNASQMKVNQRYIQIWDNPIYQDMLKRRPEAARLSERIFNVSTSQAHTVS